MTDTLSTPMRARLRANSNGKLTGEQWLDLVGAPVLPLLAMLVPLVLLFFVPALTRALRLLVLGRWVLPLIIISGVVLLVLARARHYARQPVLHATLYAADPPRRGPTVLYAEDGTPTTFRARLAPQDPMPPNTAHIVYYLDEPAGRVLLSYVATRHIDAPSYTPTERAKARLRRQL